MKKHFLNIVILLPLLFGTAKMGAQVTMGADKAPKPFSVLELVSQYKTNTHGGLRLPQMTTVQRDALGDFTSVTDAYGLMIYNTTVNCVEYWNSKKWVSLCTGTVDITLTGDCATDHLFDAGGSDACTFTPEDNSPCVMSSGAAYQVYLTAGSVYATLVVNELTAAFTLTFAPNSSSNSRIAVVRVVNCCSSEYQDFPFYQKGAECPTGVSAFTLGTSPASAMLCGDNGTVIAWVDNPDAGIDYVWEYGGAIVHTGTYMQITYPGKYTVYAGLLGCELTPSQSITVTKGGGGSSNNAPTLSATTVTPKTLTLNKDATASLSTEIKPIGANPSVTWTTGNANIATVDAAGIVTGIAAGKVVITAKTINGYSATCTVTVTANKIGEASPSLSEGDVRVYPNPTSGLLTITCYRHCGLDPQFPDNDEIADISTSLNDRNDIHNVEIFDVYDRNVSRLTSYIAHPISIDISHLPTGVYFVRITTENGTVTRKVIKK